MQSKVWNPFPLEQIGKTDSNSRVLQKVWSSAAFVQYWSKSYSQAPSTNVCNSTMGMQSE